MFAVTSPRLNTRAGDVEFPDFTAEEDGLHVVLKGLSPVAIAYSQKDIYTGKGNDHQIGSGEDTVFTIKRIVNDDQAFDKFKGILMDGADVNDENYTSARGSVIITLKAAYMDTLSPGTHTLTAVFDDGVENVSFKVIEAEEFKVKVNFEFLRSDGNRGLPFDIKKGTVNPVLTIKHGDEAVSKSGALTVEIIPGGPNEYPVTASFPKAVKDLTPGKYAVDVSGLPKEMEKDIPDSADKPKYKLTAKAEVNEKDGETVITVYLIFANPAPPEPVVYPLPEDEIGAYTILKDGTKEYLLFHTYDICIAWLGSDELCRGPEHCFHKDGK